MRAKIMVLSGQGQEAVATCAQQIMTDVSAAFGHSFSLMEGKIGETLEDRVLSACQDCQAAFVCDSESAGVQELFDGLDLPLSLRSFSVPEALCGRHEAPVTLYVGTVLSLDEETLRQAARCAFSFAQEQDCRLCAVTPNGSAKADWEAALRVQEMSFPSVSSVSLSAPEAVSAMITAPERMGFVLCPPYAGGILHAAGTALCTHPAVVHDMAWDGEMGVYAAVPSPDGKEGLPFSAALALAKLLRYSLRLPREAACVEAAVGNVLSSFHRALRESGGAAVPDGRQALDIICEQISVAGELMHRGGIG